MQVKNVLKLRNPHCLNNPHCGAMHFNGIAMGNPNANANAQQTDWLKVAGYGLVAYALYLAWTGRLESTGAAMYSPVDAPVFF